MLKRLRWEFIAITMGLVGLVLAVALGTTLAMSASAERALTSETLERALDGEDASLVSDGSDSGGADVALTITVDVASDGTVLARSNTPVQIPTETLYAIIVEALTADSSEGTSADYHISWRRRTTEAGYRVAIVDTYSRDGSLKNQALTEACVFVVTMGALFLLVRRLADWALRPVEESWEAQRRFVSDASHELKTPLAVIMANAQILDAEKGLEPEARHWVKSTLDEASHMRELVEDLLVLARTDEQRVSRSKSAVRVPVDLSSLVDGCALEFDAVAFERGSSIESRVDPGISVTGDPSELGRVTRTLLDNATKYALRGTAVTVALARDGRKARLTVSNRGEAIAPEDLEHLFDRFYRTDAARERQAEGGFGLGLAIAKGIVEAHGGKIEVASTAEAGTTFTVTLQALPEARA